MLAWNFQSFVALRAVPDDSTLSDFFRAFWLEFEEKCSFLLGKLWLMLKLLYKNHSGSQVITIYIYVCIVWWFFFPKSHCKVRGKIHNKHKQIRSRLLKTCQLFWKYIVKKMLSHALQVHFSSTCPAGLCV